MKLLHLSLLALAASACLTASRTVEVKLRDVHAVDVAVTQDDGTRAPLFAKGRPVADAPLAVTAELMVADRSLLTETGEPRGGRTVVDRVRGAPPATVPVHDGRFTWRRGVRADERARAAGLRLANGYAELVASTPVDNVVAADVVTHWTQPWGVLPSLAAITAGGFVAVGAGVAGGASLVDAASADPAPDALATGVALTTLAVAGAALTTYGIVTFALVSGPPTRSELPLR